MLNSSSDSLKVVPLDEFFCWVPLNEIVSGSLEWVSWVCPPDWSGMWVSWVGSLKGSPWLRSVGPLGGVEVWVLLVGHWVGPLSVSLDQGQVWITWLDRLNVCVIPQLNIRSINWASSPSQPSNQLIDQLGNKSNHGIRKLRPTNTVRRKHQPANQRTRQPASQITSQTANKPTSQPANQPNQPNQPTEQTTNICSV